MNSNKISDRIKSLRISQNYTQQEICMKIHISRSSYSNYENGLRTPSIEILSLLADFYNISLDYLTGRTKLPASYASFRTEELSLLLLYRSLDQQAQKEVSSFLNFKKQASISASV